MGKLPTPARGPYFAQQADVAAASGGRTARASRASDAAAQASTSRSCMPGRRLPGGTSSLLRSRMMNPSTARFLAEGRARAHRRAAKPTCAMSSRLASVDPYDDGAAGVVTAPANGVVAATLASDRSAARSNAAL